MFKFKKVLLKFNLFLHKKVHVVYSKLNSTPKHCLLEIGAYNSVADLTVKLGLSCEANLFLLHFTACDFIRPCSDCLKPCMESLGFYPYLHGSTVSSSISIREGQFSGPTYSFFLAKKLDT